MTSLRRLLLIFVGVLTLSLGGLLVFLELGLPDVSKIETYRPDGSTTLVDREGNIIYAQGSGPKEKATFDQLPETLKQAAVASEDRRFYEHNGIDLMGIARAIGSNLRQGEFVEGGSTITQQLARVLFLNQDKNIGRKIQEALLALKIEQSYTKDEILTFYLNYSYFGAGAYGVADASKTYFNKPVAKLNLRESALIVGLLPAPSVYAPTNNPTLARKRRDIVLNRMVQAGFITEAARDQAIARPPRYSFNRIDRSSNAYFNAYVMGLLPDLVEDQELLEQGGLKIETTLDTQAQRAAQTTLQEKLRGQRRVAQGAVVSIDPSTGEIRALVGGVDYAKSKFNRATQALRQPGSAFKTFVYLTALEEGFAPTTVYVDEPLDIGGYSPKNSDGEFRGAMNLMDALAQSRNPIAVKLLRDVGIKRTIETCRRLGITTPFKENATMALGSSEVKLLEFTAAYAVLANGGVRIPPWAVKRILDREGAVLYEANSQSERVVDENIAWMMTQFLAHVVKTGTGRATEVPFPAAGKTGTTDKGTDLLFVGYTPKLVTGVWLGNDNNSPTGSSSRLAAQVWGAYMRQITPGDSPDFSEPSDLKAETRDVILAGLTGATTERGRASRPSELLTESPLSPDPETPASPEEPQDIPEEAPEQIEPAPDESLAVEPANCYEPGARNRDPRCRNRKN